MFDRYKLMYAFVPPLYFSQRMFIGDTLAMYYPMYGGHGKASNG
jgi:hypothetical protein